MRKCRICKEDKPNTQDGKDGIICVDCLKRAVEQARKLPPIVIRYEKLVQVH